MIYYELDEEEQELLDAVEAGEFVSVDDVPAAIKRAQAAAEATLSKQANINIRLSLGDLYKLKVKAAVEGLPYQTLAASILHKAV
jgi:predicted DNA binding CopG/RHH family protein